MSVNANLPVVIAAMGHVQKIAQSEQAHPEAQRALAQEAAAEALQHARSQVESPDSSEKSKLSAEKDGGNNTGRQGNPGERQKKSRPEEQPSEARDPWQGNIVDINV